VNVPLTIGKRLNADVASLPPVKRII
jgi:hypothetical protein